MHETQKTALFAAVALVLLATAALATRPGPEAGRAPDDQGQEFFPEFKIPERARALEVVEYDPGSGTTSPFKVAMKGGRWVIPSHHDYPADARDRLARTAGGLIGMTRGPLRSERAEDHKELGVLDPLDQDLRSPEGMGTRLTLRDEAGAPLADLILGKPVAGEEGKRFVRVPGQARVHAADLSGVELTTRFSDWIETDLLELDPSRVRSLIVETTRYDRGLRAIIRGDLTQAVREGPTGPWTLERPPLGPGEEPDRAALDAILQTLDTLQIVGVRPKSAEVGAVLRGEVRLQDLDERAQRDALRSLAVKGFPVVEGQIVGTDGNLYLTLDDGLAYVLQFGAITFARGEALTAGAGEESASASPDDPEGTPEPPPGAVESRFLLVDAIFTPGSIPGPVPPRPAAVEGMPRDPFARTPAERAAREQAEQAAHREAQAAHERRLEAGRRRAAELADRFAGWYYVVPGDSFRKLVVGRDALVRAAGPEPAPGLPGLPDFPGLGRPGRPPSGIPGLDLGPGD